MGVPSVLHSLFFSSSCVFFPGPSVILREFFVRCCGGGGVSETVCRFRKAGYDRKPWAGGCQRAKTHTNSREQGKVQKKSYHRKMCPLTQAANPPFFNNRPLWLRFFSAILTVNFSRSNRSNNRGHIPATLHPRSLSNGSLQIQSLLHFW